MKTARRLAAGALAVVSAAAIAWAPTVLAGITYNFLD